jgi:LysM repeat protein
MRIVLLMCLLCGAACSPQMPNINPDLTILQPYHTMTPSPTPAQPEGLVISFETPLPSPTPFIYTIVAGDTMSQIAQKFNVSLDALLAANPNVDPNAMPLGHTLQIPSNPRNLTGESTPTPAPLAVQQIACHPQLDGGMWCFALVRNDSSDFLENITAQVTLTDANSKSIASQTALLPLNILPPNSALPLSVFFAPVVPSNAKSQVRILTAIQLLPGDGRYLSAVIQNTLVQVDWSGLSAQVDGTVRLASSSKPASLVWVAAVAYDAAANVVGLRRWESKNALPAGGRLPFSFRISSIGGKIERVEFAIEARP